MENVAKCKKFIRQLRSYVSSSLNIGDPFSSRNDPTAGGNLEFDETRIQKIQSVEAKREVREMIKIG